MSCLFSHLVFDLQLTKPARDPWLLLRMGHYFQEVLHAICCGASPATVSGCACRRALGKELSHDPEVVRRHQKPSHPFVLQPSVLASGQNTAEIGLVVVGDAVGDLDVYAQAMHVFVARHLAVLEPSVIAVHTVDVYGNRSESLESLMLISADDVLEDRPAVETIQVKLVTPLRLVQRGQPVLSFDFPLFFRSVLRRLSSLAAYYCGRELDLDFRGLSATAGETRSALATVYEVELPGTRRSGLVGSATISGNVQDLYPVLRLGEMVGVGKGAAFGFGGYRVTT